MKRESFSLSGGVMKEREDCFLKGVGVERWESEGGRG